MNDTARSASAREWVCLLRGINVGGRNKVPMAQLRSALETSDFTDVRSYLQSGNVILRAVDDPAEGVGCVLAETFGVDAAIITRRASSWDHMVQINPFPHAAKQRPKQLHVLFLSRAVSKEAVDELNAHELTCDTCRIEGDMVYVDYRNGVHNNKLDPVIARALKVRGTVRNWRTVLAVHSMLKNAGFG